jgi:hypothetical protein
MGFLGYV